jgi:hypothetical protein
MKARNIGEELFGPITPLSRSWRNLHLNWFGNASQAPIRTKNFEIIVCASLLT